MMNRLVSSNRIRQHATKVARQIFMTQGCRSIAPSLLALQVPHATSSSVRLFSSSTNLIDVLKRERAEEDTRKDMPAELSELKSALEKESWKIVEDGAMTRLHRTLDNAAKVQVAFHCQDTVEYDDEPREGEEDGGEDEEPAVPVRFTVTVTKAGKTMIMSCMTVDLNASIESLAITTSTIPADMTFPATEYQGPEFTELAEDLQAAYHDFLSEEVGVSGDVVAFISMFCDYKEQVQYIKFLDDSQAILGK